MKSWGKKDIFQWGFEGRCKPPESSGVSDVHRTDMSDFRNYPSVKKIEWSSSKRSGVVWGEAQSPPPPSESFGLSYPHRIDEQFQFHILFNFATILP